MAKKRKDTEKEMTFWEHLEELRWHIVRSIAAIAIFAIIAFISKDFIFNQIILAPKSGDFITHRGLCHINIKLAGQFLMHFYISFFVGLIAAIPFVIREIWSFIKPALYENEKKYTGGAVLWSSMLFIAGVLFSYFLIVPITILFLGTYNVSDYVENQIALNSYINTVVMLSFSVGLIFELPVFIYFLTKVGIITPAFMRKNRKIMIVVILIIAAIITPPDVFSQILVAIPLFGLYELSILISDRVFKKREKEIST